LKTVHDKDEVRRAYFRDGKNKSQIAQELGMDRRTVKKLLAMSPDEAPRYHRSQPISRPVLGKHIAVIHHWLALDADAPRKQRHSAQRIYERLREEEGYLGSYSAVRDYLQQVRKRPKEFFLPLAFAPGEMAQVDWAEVTIQLAGVPTVVYLFALTLNYSGAVYFEAFTRANQEAFFQGHVNAFLFLRGIPLCITYDNLKSAVQAMLKGNKREENAHFVSFKNAWLFESRFCNPASGNEKGRVENMIKFAERNLFTPVPQVNSLAELNVLLKERCVAYQGRTQARQSETVGERLNQELPHLLPLPAHLPQPCSLVPVKADKSALVQFETNRYSVPCEYAYQQLWLKVFVDKIEITNQQTVIATHTRLKGRYQEAIRFEHYRKALERKPGGQKHFRSTEPVVLPLKTREPGAAIFPEMTVQAPNMDVYSQLEGISYDPTIAHVTHGNVPEKTTFAQRRPALS
jgi:transposase